MLVRFRWIILLSLFAGKSNEYSRFRRQSNTGCVLPEYPENGNWAVVGQGDQKPGGMVESEKILLISCNKGYKVDGSKFNICLNGQWSSEMATCSEMCPPVESSDSNLVTCTVRFPFGGVNVVKCSEPINGTIAEFKCKESYQNAQLQLQRSSYSICSGGRWNPEEPECDPACGMKPQLAQQLVANGQTAKKGAHPWLVGLYAKDTKEFLCGGSLINQRVILTAAHCVCDTEGNKLSSENFLVAMGKFHRKYDEERDLNDAQFSEIKEIFVPSLYKGDKQNFFGDIAVLVTKKIFSLTKVIQPVCVDWSRSQEEFFNSPTNTGYVAGWGKTENDSLAEVLQEIELPYINHDKCTKELPDDFNIYLTEDKICAGYQGKGKGVCRGDSGSGLVTKSRLDGKFYITGIVSSSPISETGQCEPQEYALYTKVSTYITSFINEIETLNRPPIGSCILPNQTLNGHWKVNETTVKLQPGDLVASKSVLVVTCNDGYELKDGSESIRCFSGNWTGTLGSCKEKTSTVSPCILPQYPSHGKWEIVNLMDTLKPGDSVKSGTILNVSCEETYGLAGETSIVCINGAWSEVSECLKKCSRNHPDGTLTKAYKPNGKEIELTDAIEGTWAFFDCPLSRYPNRMPIVGINPLANKFSLVCIDGSWSRSGSDCERINLGFG